MNFRVFFLIIIIICLCINSCKNKQRVKSLDFKNSEHFSSSDYAPNFDLEYLTSINPVIKEKQKISSKYGTPILLNFWATWCVPCVKEMPSLQKIAEKLNGKIQVITINADPPKMETSVINFIKKNSYTFGVFLDPELHTVSEYKISGFPETFLINSEGKFLPIRDPITNEKSIRIISERDWASNQMIESIQNAIDIDRGELK